MARWKKRVRTSVLVWRPRDSEYGFTNLVEAGHIAEMTIDYVYDGQVRNRTYYPKINLTTRQAEAVDI